MNNNIIKTLLNALCTNAKKDNTVTDIDGNVYHTVKIGTQRWMVENLKTSRFRDGSAIVENISWAQVIQSKKSAWCYYNNDPQNNPTYGKLYNWYAVADPRGLCPVGWHVPTDKEFELLVNYLGGLNVAGGTMKATTLWKAPNIGADNSSGCAALPAGFRDSVGTFDYLGHFGYFWSSTDDEGSFNAWARLLAYNGSEVGRNAFCFKENGLSVRCLCD